jgi:ABC-type amino acid transport substrate-binding protein
MVFLKKFTALLLLCILLFSLASCEKSGNDSSSETEPKTNPTSDAIETTNPEDENNSDIQYFPAQIDSDNPILTWVLVDTLGNVSMTERVAEELNKKLTAANAEYQIQFICVQSNADNLPSTTAKGRIDELNTGIYDNILNGELKDKIDLVSIFSSNRRDFLKVITEKGYYLSLEGKFSQKTLDFWNPSDKLLFTATLENKIYGIPANIVAPSIRSSFEIGSALANNNISSISDAAKENSILYDIIPTDYQTKNRSFKTLDFLTSDLMYRYDMISSAVGINRETLKAENIFETAYMADTINEMQGFYKKHYVTTNVNIENYSNVIRKAVTFYSTPYTNESGSYILPVGDSFPNYYASEFDLGVGVAASSDASDIAIDFINRIYSEPEIIYLLAYGVEGSNYKVTGGYIEITDDSYYGRQLAAGEELMEYVVKSENIAKLGAAAKERREKYYSGLDSFIPARYSYSALDFDLSAVGAQISACDTAITAWGEKLQMMYETEDNSPKKTFAELKSALKAAGADEIISEINKQIEAN